jgi:DNA-binding PadR family transcriptional regulator
MPGRFRRSNPLALAVLALAWERDMHPYEMASTLRQRRKEASVKLNYGSLYAVVDSLARHGLITAVESRRDGRRPERTVYAITDTGREELDDWLRDLLGLPVKEYTSFEAGLTFMAVLPIEQVLDLLDDRQARLDLKIATTEASLASVVKTVPRLVLVEAEYHLAMTRAERAWVAQLLNDLRTNAIDGVTQWRAGTHLDLQTATTASDETGRSGLVR